MFFIILAIFVVVGILCLVKCFKNLKEFEYDNTIYILISLVCVTCGLTLSSISINNYSNTFNIVSSNTTQYDIVEFNKSTLINKLDESYIITYKTKDNNEFKISVDNDTNIVIDNDNPTKVIIDEELKYSDWFFAHKNTVTYTFQ